MIVTAQPFFNELDLLEVKCNELLGVVHAHIIVEAHTTFTGIPKPLYFKENKERFKNFPIIHREIHIPHFASPWDRENYQMQYVRKVVKEINPEIVFWGDLDECPRASAFQAFKDSGLNVAAIGMDQLLYYFDRLDTRMKWNNAKIGWYDSHAKEQPWRGSEAQVLPDLGWHFEYLGSQKHLVEKLKAFSHAVEEPCQKFTRDIEKGNRPEFDKAVAYPESMLPKFVQDNRTRFKDMFFEEVKG